MKVHLKNSHVLALFVFILLFQFSCQKDQDLLAEAVAPDTPIEDIGEGEKDETPEDYISRTVELSPVNDAYLQDNEGYDLTIMRLEEENRTSYLMFDLSDLNGTITEASLQFTIDSDQGDGTINVSKGPAGDWTEADLNDGNAPEGDTYLGTISNTYKLGETQTVSLNTKDISAEKTTLVLRHSTGNDLAFASKENPSKKGPKLVVTYNAPITSESPTEEDTPVTEEDESLDGSAPDAETPATEAPVETPVTGGYYVTVNGKSTNDGLTEATAWNITHAFSIAKAGDVVHIKAGNYGNVQLKPDNSGLSGQPIQFIGYTNSPGDLISSQGSTFHYGDVLDSNKMPLITGSTSNGEGQGTGISLNENYINIENIQVTKFNRGLDSYGDNCKFKNIIITQIGDFNPSHSYPTATSNAQLNYNGFGITVRGKNINLTDCFVLNSGAQNITISGGENHLHENNSSYSDSKINATDYYYLLSGGSNNNIVNNVDIERVGSLQHYGHGLVLKDSAINNSFNDCQVTNTQLEVSFAGVYDNVFNNCKVLGGATGGGSILIANGAHHNTFKNCSVEDAHGISFQDWKDGYSSSADEDDAGHDNEFISCTIKNADAAINFHYYDKLGSPAHDNTFRDCSFINIETLFKVDRPNHNNKMVNCTIENVQKLSETRYSGEYSLNMIYDSLTQFIGVGFSIPN